MPNAIDVSTPTGFGSVSTAARLAEVHPATIRRALEAGHLTKYRVGRLVRIDLAELDTWLRSRVDQPA